MWSSECSYILQVWQLIGSLIDFNGMLTYLGLFYAESFLLTLKIKIYK